MAVKSSSRLKIDGIEQLTKNSNKVIKQVHRVLGGATLEAAEMMRAEAVKRAREKSGDLKRGIIAKVTWDKKKSKAFSAIMMDPDMNDVFVKNTKTGKRYYYPASIEYGHKGGAPAYPFMRRAFKTKKRYVKKIIEDHIKRAIEGAVR
jgi:HK97 gp10 family phage protein